MAKKKKHKEKSKHPFRDAIEVVVFAVVMALGLKVYAIEAYQIPTGSMMPTLMGTPLGGPGGPQGGIHDRVLVNKLSFLARDPERWEVVVFRYPLAAHTNYVKRLVGMPSETIWVREGDIWSKPNGAGDEAFVIQRKPARIQKNLWKQCWPRPGTNIGRWQGWERDKAAGDAEGVLTLEAGAHVRSSDSFRDEYEHGFDFELWGKLPAKISAGGPHAVRDLKIEFDATPSAAQALVLDMIYAETSRSNDAQRESLQLTLDAAAGEVRLLRPDGQEDVHELDMPLNRELRVRLAWWDHQLSLEIDGADSLEVFETLTLASFRSRSNRVSFSAAQGGWRLKPPTLWRDVHYLPPNKSYRPADRPDDPTDSFAVPEGHYFMMGDNTQDSHDSRDWEYVEVELDEPVAGFDKLRGDHFKGAANPFTNNPRWNRDGTALTFREENGDLFSFPFTDKDEQLRVRAPFVPREYVLGKPMAVFLPIPPFAPVWRMEVVW